MAPVVPGSITTTECVFCRATDVPMSDEHVFGNWIHRLFGRDPNGRAEVVNAEGVPMGWNRGLFSDVLTIVCDECNNEWMSVMENDVSALLGPMILDGRTTVLPPPFQAKLAAWAVKTAFVADYLPTGSSVVPEAEYDRSYRSADPDDERRRLPLSGQMVWIAHRATFLDQAGRRAVGQILMEPMLTLRVSEGEDGEAAKTNLDTWLSQGMGGCYFSITCGHFVCQVVGHNFPIAGQIDVNAREPDQLLRQIWPVSEPLTWPPPAAIETIGGLEALHRALPRP